MTGWQRSSYCDTNACVEVSASAGEVRVRDSKNPDGPQLVFTPEEWTAFTAGVRGGEFDF